MACWRVLHFLIVLQCGIRQWNPIKVYVFMIAQPMQWSVHVVISEQLQKVLHYHMGESSKFPKSWILEIQNLKLALCLQYSKNIKINWSVNSNIIYKSLDFNFALDDEKTAVLIGFTVQTRRCCFTTRALIWLIDCLHYLYPTNNFNKPDVDLCAQL